MCAHASFAAQAVAPPSTCVDVPAGACSRGKGKHSAFHALCLTLVEAFARAAPVMGLYREGAAATWLAYLLHWMKRAGFMPLQCCIGVCE